MKKYFTILLMMFSITTFAQFPAPTNFEYSLNYIMIDQEGYCEGNWVAGPTYCSNFSWAAPNTTTTNATLDHYNIYYYNYWTHDTTIIASTSELYYELEFGPIGEMWITAVYTNPEGESGPSNIVINDGLPISISEYKSATKITIQYDQTTQEITITNGEKIGKINLYDSEGKTMTSTTPVNNKICIENLPSGLYIVELITKDSKVIRQKIIKQ
jgi:hypothetical protein